MTSSTVYSSTLTVMEGSSIDGNTAKVSSPASLSPLSSRLIRQGAIDARSPRKTDFAMLELRVVAAIARVSARSPEEAPTCLLPR